MQKHQVPCSLSATKPATIPAFYSTKNGPDPACITTGYTLAPAGKAQHLLSHCLCHCRCCCHCRRHAIAIAIFRVTACCCGPLGFSPVCVTSPSFASWMPCFCVCACACCCCGAACGHYCLPAALLGLCQQASATPATTQRRKAVRHVGAHHRACRAIARVIQALRRLS
jgi:hypothetical protein